MSPVRVSRKTKRTRVLGPLSRPTPARHRKERMPVTERVNSWAVSLSWPWKAVAALGGACLVIGVGGGTVLARQYPGSHHPDLDTVPQIAPEPSAATPTPAMEQRPVPAPPPAAPQAAGPDIGIYVFPPPDDDDRPVAVPTLTATPL